MPLNDASSRENAHFPLMPDHPEPLGKSYDLVCEVVHRVTNACTELPKHVGREKSADTFSSLVVKGLNYTQLTGNFQFPTDENHKHDS